MVLFSDWLGPNVEDEIELGIAWRQENAESKSQIKHSQTLEQMYSNDGSNLRFTHEPDHDNTAVQIFKLLQDHGNSDQKFVDALASDTHTSIKIRFSSECIQSLRKQNERILDSLRGAIFFLKQFEIVVAYVGALGIDIVWLLVKEAQYHGQSGLGMLGKPKPIHKRPRIQHLLTRLNQDPADEDMESQCAGSPSRKTPLSDHNPEEEASAMTGTQFGTQVVTSAIRPRKNPAVGLSRDSHPGHGTAVPGKVDPVALLQQLGTTNDPRRQSGKPVETPKRNRTPAQAPAIAKKIKKEPTDPVPPREPEATDENDKVGSHSNIVKDGLIAPAAVPSVELPGGFRNTKENTPIASGPSPQYRMLDQPSNPVASFRESPPVDAARPPQSLPSMIETDDAPTSFQAPLPENHSSTQTTSSASANLAPHDGLDRILQTDDSQLVNPSLPSSTSGPAQSSGSNAQSANSKASKSIASAGPWKETLLISRAICRVPEDQEEILNKFESWLPPPSGRIFPVARLPESVLTSLSTRTEEATKARQKEQPSSSNPTAVEGSNSQTTSVSTTDDEDGDAENEDDPSNAEPASSAEIPWSLSPADHYGRLADYELPPNSSADQQSPKRATGRAPDFGDFPVDSSAEQQSNPRPPSSRIHKKTNVAGSGPPELMTTEVSQNQATSARPIENALDEESTDMLGNLAGSGAGTYSGKPTTTMIKQEGGLDAPSTPNQHQAFDLNLQSLPMQSTEAAHSEMSQSFDQTYLEDSDDVLAQFRAAYPEYNGDHEHFENLCHHLYCLSQSFPLSVWDDYVGRHKTEYIPYMGNCAHKGLDPLPYSEFYINKVDEVKHTKRILNKSSLAPIFERLNNQTSNRQARNRSRSPVSEQRRQSKALGVPSSAYRERSPVPTRSTSPTTTQPGSVAVRPWGTERSQRFPVAEKRQSRVSLGGHVSEYRERSPFGRPSIPISADYGSPNRRQSMPVRARDSGDNHRFRGESYRPPPRSEYDATLEQSLPARPSHALPDERQQQPQVHKRLPEELSPKVQRLPDPDPSPSGRSPSSASFQRVPAAQASSSSQHRPQPITTKLSAPGPSNPSVALDKTNAKPVPSASVGQSKAPTTTATRVERSSFDNSTLASGSNTPAGTLTKNLVRRGGGGGGGGRGRGRGGFNRPSHRGAAADASTIQTFSDASRASGTSPPKPPETTNPATPFVDLTSSPPKNPVGYGRSGGAERGRGSFASSRGGPGTGGDARRGGDDDRPRSAFGHKTADVQAAVNARVDATIAGLQQAKPTAKLTTTATPRVAATTSSSTPTITKSTNNNTPMAKTTTTSPAAVRSRYPAPPPPLKTAKTPSRAGSTASAASSPQQAGKATKRKKKKSSELPGMLKELKKTWKEQQRDNQSPDAGGGGRAPSRVS
ncbi:hypothetical protein BKA80DRAFT_306764 [Phyllosticta citrichinensis]